MAPRPHGLPARARRRSPSSSVRPTGARSRKAGSMYRGQRSGGSMMWMSLSRTLKAPWAMAHLRVAANVLRGGVGVKGGVWAARIVDIDERIPKDEPDEAQYGS